MAAYREHITFSTLLGVGYAVGSSLLLGLSPTQGAMAGWFTALGGMLPDLDSNTGRPVREMFSLVAALLPLILVQHVVRLLGITPNVETIMLLIVVMYLLIKYGGQKLVGAVSVHRGMFHSLPAMLIASEIVYLGYPSEHTRVKLWMAVGIGIGFFSHLLLDEVYSVEWSGVRLKVKKSAGSAIKMFGKLFVPNVVTYSLLATLTYAVLVDAGLIIPRARQETPSLATDRQSQATDAGLEDVTVDLGVPTAFPDGLPVSFEIDDVPTATAAEPGNLVLPR